ncbi:hypothetical protein JYU34_012519 [Plutella xylostella]|uniref:Uncharacterized protein n=1 Tax=Plutella xylostella TaxID=51655 RepID=A0ABQ7QBZ7_PLUXY|nr:hypothetical protein JYU34_012519 [Plutella xylostella]
MAALLLLKSMILSKALQKSKKKKKPDKKTKQPKQKQKAFSYRSGTETCRVCSQSTADIPIFNNHLEPHLADEILHFSGVLIQESDKLTKFMCQSCYDLLHGCILFRDMCQRSDKAFHEAHDESVRVKTEIPDFLDPPDDPFLPLDSTLDGGGGDSSGEDAARASDDAARGSDDSYQVPSPVFSDSALWGCAACCKDFNNLPSYNKHLPKCKARFIKQDKAPPEPGPGVGKKRFLCDTCGKTAKSKASLLVHMSTHDNIFPFKCDVCPYQGRTIDLLKVHKRSHLVDKPFKCTQCPKATTTSSNLAKHMRHVHSTSRPFKNLQCTYCEKMFSYQHDMKRHVRDIHLRQGTVECDLCYKKFNTKKILQGHRWKVHKIKSDRSGRLPAYLLCQMEQQHPDMDEHM